MQRAYRHSEPKKPLPKARKRAVKPAKAANNGGPKKLTAPIFNTRYAGMKITYIRPFDPVWPTEEPEPWPEKQKS